MPKVWSWYDPEKGLMDAKYGPNNRISAGFQVLGADAFFEQITLFHGPIAGASELSISGTCAFSGSVIYSGTSKTVFSGTTEVSGGMVITGSLTVTGSDTLTVYGPSVFDGNVTVSGTLRAEKMIVEVDEVTTGSLEISGTLFVSQSATVTSRNGH